MTVATTIYSKFNSPIGTLLLLSDGEVLTGIHMELGCPKIEADWQKNDEPFSNIRRELTEYFAGELRRFRTPYRLRGTEFQIKVWETLASIPYGETISYAELARRVGNAKASRAVGAANGRNPLPIYLPCHRVIGADGSMTGFGGGIERKEFLLELEAKTLPERGSRKSVRSV